MKGEELIYKTLIIFLLVFSFKMYSQPEIVWEHGFGGNGDDRSFSILQTIDSGFLTIGFANSTDGNVTLNKGASDYWVVKTNALGELEWQHSYGGSGNDYCYAVCHGEGGGYLLAGSTFSIDADVSENFGQNDYWLVKIDDLGNIEWEKSYGGSSFENCLSVTKSQSGGYIILGESFSNDGMVSGHHGATSTSDLWIVKINSLGIIEWQKSYGSSEDEYAGKIIQALNSDYVIVGSTQGYDGDVIGNWGALDYWILRITEIGEMVWSKSMGGSDWDEGKSIIEIENGRFIISGHTPSNDGLISGYHGGIYDGWVLSIDSLGNLIWAKTFGGSDVDADFTIMKKNSNEFALTGRSHSDDGDLSINNGGNDYWIFAIDSIGNILWQKSIGGSDEDASYGLTISYDDNYVIAGASHSGDLDVSPTYLSWNYWIVKLGFCNNNYYADNDGDGFGDALHDSISCNLPIGYVSDSSDCDDINEFIFPTATDICNLIDDNCNGLIDEDAIFTTLYSDIDEDGFGDILNDSVSCYDLEGYVIDNTDCNDLNDEINIESIEICNGIDDNCNFVIDEGLIVNTFYIDEDEDNFGNSDIFINSCLELIAGYVYDSTDCDDANDLIFPSNLEICDYIDNDCNGIIDDNITYILTFEDADGDNFGNIEVDTLSCSIPDGFVENNTDCDDANPLIYPGAVEILNGIDDDCNMLIDEGLSLNENTPIAIKIYPNPTNDILYVEYTDKKETNIQILNAVGEIIEVLKITYPANDIDVSKFAAGIYLLKIVTGNNDIILKFVKE